MRVAALSDIHGNLAALEAVLAEVPGDALIVVGGDTAMGPLPAETLARVRSLGDRARWVRGNADRELGDEAGGLAPPHLVDWVRSRLSQEEIAFLHALPEQQVVDVDGLGPTLFVHATPRNDVEIFTELTPAERLLPVFSHVRERTVVCGHTHMQFDRTVGGVRIVNAGSVGMPYEDEPGAYWALLGPDVELRRTAYEPQLEGSGFPDEWPTVSREAARAQFEAAALGA